MRTTAYLKAIMEVNGKTITGLGPSVSMCIELSTAFTAINPCLQISVQHNGFLFISQPKHNAVDAQEMSH